MSRRSGPHIFVYLFCCNLLSYILEENKESSSSSSLYPSHKFLSYVETVGSSWTGPVLSKDKCDLLKEVGE